MFKKTIPSSSLTNISWLAKNIFKTNLLFEQEYSIEVQSPYFSEPADFNYGLINDEGWISGVINNKDQHSLELVNLKTAMIIGMCIVIVIGLIVVYVMATPMTNRMLHIANYLGITIKNEFKDSVPTELLENEDEIGIIAREIKNLEEEMTKTLASIKESINYLNDQVSREDEIKAYKKKTPK